MNQNFSFMKKLVPKILAKQKFITNRAYTEFRVKCKSGDIMHLFTGMRTPNCQKIGDALIKERVYWEPQEIPIDTSSIANISPILMWTWEEFAKKDGFDNYNDFYNYFSQKRYKNGILCYRFELLTMEKMT